MCDHAVIVGGPWSVVCTAYIYTGALFPKIKRGMAAFRSVATPLRVYMLRTYNAVILALVINSLKNETNVCFFCYAVVERLRAEMISK